MRGASGVFGVFRYGANITNPETAAEDLRQYLQRVYDKYGKPIWLTEFALINFANYNQATGTYTTVYPTWENQARFATLAIAKLNALHFVERYAWYSLPAPSSAGTNNLASGGRTYTLTPVGQSFRDA